MISGASSRVSAIIELLQADFVKRRKEIFPAPADALMRQRFEIFEGGYPTQEGVMEIPLGEILSFVRLVGLT